MVGNVIPQIRQITEWIIMLAPYRTEFSPAQLINQMQSDTVRAKYFNDIMYEMLTDYPYIKSELLNGDFVRPIDSGDTYILTKKGQRFKDCGSYDKYDAYAMERIKQKKDIRDLAVVFPKRQLFTNKVLIIVFAITAIFSGIAAYTSWQIMKDTMGNKTIRVNVANPNKYSPQDTIRVMPLYPIKKRQSHRKY